MKIIIELDNEKNIYELNEKNLNSKQIELIAHIFEIPEMLEYIKPEAK